MLESTLPAYPHLWQKHGILAIIAWCPVVFVCVATVAWFSAFWKFSLIIHTITGLIVLGLTVTTTVAALDYYRLKALSIHAVLGLAVTGLVALLSLTGFVLVIVRMISRS